MTGQYIPLQMLNTSPPTLTQQITSQGVISPEAWVQIQEKVNALAENNELIDKHQQTLGRSHQKLKKLTKVIHKNTESSTSRPSSTKPYPKKIEEKQDKKKVKFGTPPIVKEGNKDDKQVNVVKAIDSSSTDSESENSESLLPEESSGSLGEQEQTKYFDLLSSSSDYDSNNNSDDE